MIESYVYVITALLPLSALMLVLQVNPYHALVIQGIQGAVAALVYAVLGAADVALTQALMGTLLAVTLYAIAVRSSMVMRLGVLEDDFSVVDSDSSPENQPKGYFQQLKDELQTIFNKRHLRLELVPYTNRQALQRALMDKEVHATCTQPDPDAQHHADSGTEKLPYHTQIRIRRIYEIIQTELASPITSLTYVNVPDSGEKN